MKRYGLCKADKLCSATAITLLFSDKDSFATLAYPLRVVSRPNPARRSGGDVTFLISVPKKRLRHAVDRVRMRRRIREAYRLLRPRYPITGVRCDIAFVYVASELTDYAKVAAAMERLLAKLSAHYAQSSHSDK